MKRQQKHGTARDLTEHATGYAGNGASIYTRHVAHNTAPARQRTCGELITITMRELGKCQQRLRNETDPYRRAKLLRDIEIKSSFLSRLGEEQRRSR